MFKPLLSLLAAIALTAPLSAQDPGNPPLDPACPRGDLDPAREAGSICIGKLTDASAFAFIYPGRAAAIPALDALLSDEALRAEVRFEGLVQANRDKKEGAPGRMLYEQVWRVDAAVPELIALSGATGLYLGGAHGGIEYRTMLFDRLRNRRIELSDIFSVGALEHGLLGQRPVGEGAVQRAFCRALREEVRERRGEATARIECPEALDLPITLVCSERRRIESMRALIAPYVVGSWSEGPYEVEFPIDAMMMAAIRRRFRPAFAVPAENRPRQLAEPCR